MTIRYMIAVAVLAAAFGASKADDGSLELQARAALAVATASEGAEQTVSISLGKRVRAACEKASCPCPETLGDCFCDPASCACCGKGKEKSVAPVPAEKKSTSQQQFKEVWYSDGRKTWSQLEPVNGPVSVARPAGNIITEGGGCANGQCQGATTTRGYFRR